MTDTDSRNIGAGDGTALDLADAAHRLLTPLTAIKGYADLLMVTDDAQTVRDYVETIRSNAALLDRMLTDLGEGRMPTLPGDKA